MKSEVSIIRCADYAPDAVYKAVKAGIDLVGGIDAFVRPGERILVKPNLLAGKPPEAAVTTHPSIVRAAVMLVQEAGAEVVLGDSSALGKVNKNAQTAGYDTLAKELGVEFVELADAVTAENPGGTTFKKLEVAKLALTVDGIINLPKLKTHAQMYMTLGVKNIFGCIPGRRKAQWHLASGINTDSFAQMLLDLHTLLTPRLTVMDAITGMEGNGPASGEPRDMGLLLTGRDTLALDRVATEIVGARCRDIPVMKLAAEQSNPSVDLASIKVLGETVKEVAIKDFVFPPIISIDFTDKLPDFISKRLKKALTSRPVVNEEDCVLCNVCVKTCPAEIMETARCISIDYEGCIRCYCCQEVCPKGAILVKEGWLKKMIPGL